MMRTAQPRAGGRAARKVAAGSTPERQLLVCLLSPEGTLTAKGTVWYVQRTISFSTRHR